MFFDTYNVFEVFIVVISTISTTLMFYLWRFNAQSNGNANKRPAHLYIIHRILGYTYALVYAYLMYHIVERLWNYQLELPARIVAHFVVGMTIGAILFVKVIILRFFRYLQTEMLPALGTFLFIATLLLVGLELPFALHENYLHLSTSGTKGMDSERIERVRTYLPLLGLKDSKQLKYLSSSEGLIDGRTTMVHKCTQCHDLRTVLARPRTPDRWLMTVRRMAERSLILEEISEEEIWSVTAYLIAISPTLQRGMQNKRQQDILADQSRQAADEVAQRSLSTGSARTNIEWVYEPKVAKQLFEQRCSLCHNITVLAENPPWSREQTVELVERMVLNGLTGSEEELFQIIEYINDVYVENK